MFKKILIVLILVIAGFAIAAALQPPEFSVQRSKTINAPAADVFAQVNEIPKWQAWSPWVEEDPQSKVTFDGPAAGVNASMKWAGEKVGEGTMTVIESKPNEYIKFKLDFVKPFQGTNFADFTFKEEGGKTLVTWRNYGELDFKGKAMNLVGALDKMLGGAFDKGLTNLKREVEKTTEKAK